MSDLLMSDLIERYTKSILWQLEAYKDTWLLFSQLQDLANVPEKELTEILTTLYKLQAVEIQLAEGEFPDDVSEERKQSISHLLLKNIGESDTIPPGILNLMVVRLSPNIKRSP